MSFNAGSAYLELEGKDNGALKLLEDIQGKLGGLQGAISTLGTAFKGLAIGAAVKETVIDLTKQAIFLGDKLEQAKISFTTMLGSAEAADTMLKQLATFSSNTPFELIGLRDTAKQLLAFGVESYNILPTLKMLGDVSAGLSVPIEQVAYAYGQVRVAGRLMGGELMQFTNAGVPMIEYLSKVMKVSQSEIKKMVSQGKVGFSDVQKAFQLMTAEGEKFGNLMEKQTVTLTGKWSNFKDRFNLTLEQIGTALLPLAKGVIVVMDFMLTHTKNAFYMLQIVMMSTVSFAKAKFYSLSTFFAQVWTVIEGTFNSGVGILRDFGANVGIFAHNVGVAFSALPQAIKNSLNKGIELLEKFLNTAINGVNKFAKKLGFEGNLVDNVKLGRFDVDYTKANYKEYSTINRKISSEQNAALLKDLDDKKNYNDRMIEIEKQALKTYVDNKLKFEEATKVNTELTLSPDSGVGGDKKTGGKSASEKLKEELDKKIKLLEENAKKEVDIVKKSTLSEEEKSIKILSINKKLEEDIMIVKGETLKLDEKNAKEYLDKKKEDDKKIAESAKKSYETINDKIKESLGRLKDYGEKLTDLKDKFTELKKSAKEDLLELANSITELNREIEDIQTNGTTERSGMETDATIELAKRRVEILKRQSEIEKELSSEKSKKDYDAIKINELNQESVDLGKELNYINENTTAAVRKQVEEYEKLSEAEKTMYDLKKDLDKQKLDESTEIAKIEEEKKSLLEKKAISDSILNDRQMKITQEGDTLKAFYTDQEGKEVEIKDFKNIQYAQDLENKRLAITSQLEAVEKGITDERILLEGFFATKTQLEKDYSIALAEEKLKQKAEMDKEIEETKKSIKIWNEYWKAKRSGNGNVSVNDSTGDFKGFANGGYTGNIGKNNVAGIVHGNEYVIPANVINKLAGTGILESLEMLRKGFSGGGYTSKVPSISNVSSPSLNVTQNIASGLDIGAAIRELSYMLRISS